MSACFHTNNVTCDNCRGVRFNLTPPSGVSSDSVVLVAGEGLRFRPADALRITDESVLALRQRLAEVEKERDEYKAKLDAELPAAWREDLASLDQLNERLCRERDEARAEIERLRWAQEMGCENTPTRGCECPGCETARQRAERGETGP